MSLISNFLILSMYIDYSCLANKRSANFFCIESGKKYFKLFESGDKIEDFL